MPEDDKDDLVTQDDQITQDDQQSDPEPPAEPPAPSEPTEEEVAALAAKFGFVKPEPKPEPKPERMEQKPLTLEQRAKVLLLQGGIDDPEWEQLEAAKDAIRLEDFKIVALKTAESVAKIERTKQTLAKDFGEPVVQEFEAALAETSGVELGPEALTMLEDLAIGRAQRKGKGPQKELQRTVTQTVTTDTVSYADPATRQADAAYDAVFGQGAAARKRQGK